MTGDRRAPQLARPTVFFVLCSHHSLTTPPFAVFKIALESRRDRIGAMLSPAMSPAYLTDRCCLTCGYRGRELQGRRGQERLVCPQCRQDLYSRPARTYAEMEGLAQPCPRATSEPLPLPGRRRMSILRFAGGLLGAGILLVCATGRPMSRRRGLFR